MHKWNALIEAEFSKPYGQELKKKIDAVYSSGLRIHPEEKNLFRAFELTPYEDVRVVIIGQDPYHGLRQANGLAFAVNGFINAPPSLSNIFKAVKNDIGKAPTDKTLVSWAEQGVLLLNCGLTVEHKKPNSHANFGWHEFTGNMVKYLSERKEPIVFMLWGNFAQQKEALIADHHLVLKTYHPSPFSARHGFFDCKHWSQANQFLKEHYGETIAWA